MTGQLSEEYTRLTDYCFVLKQRIVILENASVHVALNNLEAVQSSLPPNTAVIAQPLDQVSFEL